MNTSELIDVLESAGLSPYQANAYVTLLELGETAATNLADKSEVPDPRIYDVLRDLEADGYVETYEQGSLYARANDPETVLEDLRERATQYTAAADEIQHRWEQPSMEEPVVSIVERFETVLKHAKQAIESANQQVLLSLNVEQYEELKPTLESAIDSGVMINLSFETDGGSVEDLPDEDELRAVCSEARYRPFPSPFVAIVDRSKTFFSPHTGSINEYGLLVDDWTHTYVFHWFFLSTLWDVWDPFYSDSVDGLPRDYVDIRYCIRDIVPALEDDRTIRVSVDGRDLETGESRVVEGDVVDVTTTESINIDEFVSVAQFAGRVSITVDTPHGLVEVGGWGATLEDVEATHITLTEIV